MPWPRVLAAVSLAVTVRLGAPHYTRSGLDAYVLDVGQGESVLLTSGGKFALVDCGSRNSWYDAGGIAADHLATMGCGTLDYLILTHYDYDHVSGVGGRCWQEQRVDTLLLPDVSDDAGARFRVELAARNHGVDIAVRGGGDGLHPGGEQPHRLPAGGTWRATTNRGWPSCAPMATTTC